MEIERTRFDGWDVSGKTGLNLPTDSIPARRVSLFPNRLTEKVVEVFHKRFIGEKGKRKKLKI